MVSLPRLRQLDRLAQLIDQQGIPGDVVECGTCNGGSAAILARIASQSPFGRHTFLLDSFAGLPPPGPKDTSEATEYTGSCRGDTSAVRAVLKRVGVPEAAVTLVPGWFHDTLPSLPERPIALLHIDADWYDSVRICLEHLYDRVSPGGYIVLDDYGYWQGCRIAWQELALARGLQVDLVPVDGIGVWLRKPAGKSVSRPAMAAEVPGQ
jgi:O-methyltransferase